MRCAAGGLEDGLQTEQVREPSGSKRGRGGAPKSLAKASSKPKQVKVHSEPEIGAAASGPCICVSALHALGSSGVDYDSGLRVLSLPPC